MSRTASSGRTTRSRVRGGEKLLAEEIGLKGRLVTATWAPAPKSLPVPTTAFQAPTNPLASKRRTTKKLAQKTGPSQIVAPESARTRGKSATTKTKRQQRVVGSQRGPPKKPASKAGETAPAGLDQRPSAAAIDDPEGNHTVDPQRIHQTFASITKPGVVDRASSPIISPRLAHTGDIQSWIGELPAAALGDSQDTLADRPTPHPRPTSLHPQSSAVPPSSTIDIEAMASMPPPESFGSRQSGELTGKPTKANRQKLRFRKIKDCRSDDPKLKYFQLILRTSPPEARHKNISHVKDACTSAIAAIDGQPNTSCSKTIQTLAFEIAQSKAKLKRPMVLEEEFSFHLEACLKSNEAYLQRTIMMFVLNIFWISEPRGNFIWNAEGQWKQPVETLIKPKRFDLITLPKPDSSVSFSFNALAGRNFDANVPPALEGCLYPDDCKELRRCFPFFFMEVKKSDASIEDAHMANMHTASQALYNIYQWMADSGQKADFFAKVRIFTFAFNAQALYVRIHRAELDEADQRIGYYWDDFLKATPYTKDQTCSLVTAILEDYAEEILLPLLQTSFKIVTRQEDEREVEREAEREANREANKAAQKGKGKRRASQADRANNKRRPSQGNAGNEHTESTQEFANFEIQSD